MFHKLHFLRQNYLHITFENAVSHFHELPEGNKGIGVPLIKHYVINPPSKSY